MKILHALLALLFLVFALVQFNDPDPLLWVCMYLLVATVPALALFGRLNKWVLLVAVLVCLVAVVISGAGFVEFLTQHRSESIITGMDPSRMYIEESRETLGALLGLAVVAFYVLRARKRQEKG